MRAVTDYAVACRTTTALTVRIINYIRSASDYINKLDL